MTRLKVKTKLNMHFEYCSEIFTTEESIIFKFETSNNHFQFCLDVIQQLNHISLKC